MTTTTVTMLKTSILHCTVRAACANTAKIPRAHAWPLPRPFPGLWPNNYDGSYPCTCTNDQFNLTTVKPLVPQLLKYWPSYKCNDNDDNGYCDSSFWAHEYEKHGTCALGAPGISDQYEYFETTLSLRNKYAILPALANKGIYPSDDDGHYLDDIKNAVKAYNGGSPSVWCDNDNNISSFITCYDSQLQPTDCPSNDKCSGDKVYMPTHA